MGGSILMMVGKKNPRKDHIVVIAIQLGSCEGGDWYWEKKGEVKKDKV